MEPHLTHIQFSSIASTQKFLLELPFSSGNFYLVSTIYQTSGIGRRGNVWQKFSNGLSFSFNLPVQKDCPLSLHLGNILVSYFMEKFETKLFLKWPNDIFTENFKKCGGILTQRKNNMDYIGIGLNMNTSDSKNFDHLSLSGLDNNYQHLIPQDIHEYIVNYNKKFSTKDWLNNCLHLNKEVELIGEEQSFTGINTGVEENGAIKIEKKQECRTFQYGSLRLL
jgi:BirA family biotin operon repressor/biotin-[acetyl-CoA-carboxylase] ligase